MSEQTVDIFNNTAILGGSIGANGLQLTEGGFLANTVCAVIYKNLSDGKKIYTRIKETYQ